LSRIIYYGAIQNFIFTALQNALMFLIFDDEEDEEEKKKYYKTYNSMLDNLLRGLGYGGALVSMLKNVGIDIYERTEKQKDPDTKSYKGPEYYKSALKLLDFSPPLDIKVSKFLRALENWEYNSWRPETSDPFSINNPAYESAALMIASTTNIPLDRLVQKSKNIQSALEKDQEVWRSFALLAGWSEWQLQSSDEKATERAADKKLKLEIRAKDKPSLYTKEQQQSVLKQHGYSDKEILDMKNEDDRSEAILKSQKDNNKVYTPNEKIKVVKPKKSNSKFKSTGFNKSKSFSSSGFGKSNEKILLDMNKSEQVDSLITLGLTKEEIKKLRYEKDRVEKILELNKKD